MSRTRLARRRRRSAGFTLMEVLLVVAILVILASLATVAIRSAMIGAQKNAAGLNATTIKNAVNQYYLSVNRYPSTIEDLVTPPQDLADPTRWSGPYLEGGIIPVDPWNQQFRYMFDQSTMTFRVSSAGPNGVFDDEDDVYVDGG